MFIINCILDFKYLRNLSTLDLTLCNYILYQTVDACTFLYKRLERQSVLKGFGCVDGEYPEKSSDITPTKLEQITGF